MQARERFLSRVMRQKNGCWLWTGGVDTYGYGKLNLNGKTWLVHRLSYLIHKGEIPTGMNVNHTCDVRNCVNPNHLWIGTQYQNCLDKTLKGRSCRKLSREKIEQILKEPGSARSVGIKFGVDPSLIGKIRKRSRWKILPETLDAPLAASV